MGRSAPPSGPTGRGGGGGGGVARVGWAGWTTAGALVASTTGATDPVSTTPGAMESGVGLTRSPIQCQNREDTLTFKKKNVVFNYWKNHFLVCIKYTHLSFTTEQVGLSLGESQL